MTTFDWDALAEPEARFMERVREELAAAGWARPLLETLERAGGVRRENKSTLFELRFAHSLMLAGLTAEYETAGDGTSTVDFGVIHEGQTWRIELMRLADTQAAIEATTEHKDEDGVVWSSRFLSTTANDKRQSTEGETLKAIERICQKCERDGKPHKFPALDGAMNVLLVDLRTFLGGGDKSDRLHIAFGSRSVRPEFQLAWEGKPITGVFDPATMLKGAKEARERLHFVGFAHERTFRPGGLAETIELVANPHLFKDEDELRAVMKTWPLPPANVLNIRH